MEQPLEQLVGEARSRLTKQREELVQQQQQLSVQLEDIDRELTAIAAYESAKTKSTTSTTPSTMGKRAQLINLLKGSSTGMSRKDILHALGVQDDKAGKQAVSNALSALRKQGKVAVSPEGVYTAV